jgi:hypothetical protein
MDRNDVGMMQAGGGLGLSAEPQHHLCTAHPARVDHLHRDDPVEAQLPCFVHYSHAAVGDLRDQFVVAKAARIKPRPRPPVGC